MSCLTNPVDIEDPASAASNPVAWSSSLSAASGGDKLDAGRLDAAAAAAAGLERSMKARTMAPRRLVSRVLAAGGGDRSAAVWKLDEERKSLTSRARKRASRESEAELDTCGP